MAEAKEKLEEQAKPALMDFFRGFSKSAIFIGIIAPGLVIYSFTIPEVNEVPEDIYLHENQAHLYEPLITWLSEEMPNVSDIPSWTDCAITFDVNDSERYAIGMKIKESNKEMKLVQKGIILSINQEDFGDVTLLKSVALNPGQDIQSIMPRF
ncbi:hypothetical protein N9B94_00980 [Verrucomicrobia bacterium]|nr:hypothetical protein [Verrucomicrobiota bacterium]